MKKLLYVFLFGALMVHITPLSAGNGNDKKKRAKKKRAKKRALKKNA